MNNQQVKRRNPFASPISARNEEKEQTIETKVEEPVKVDPQPIKPVEEPKIEEEQPKQVSKPVAKTVKVTPKQKQNDDSQYNKEKFTSTMDVTLRRKIKIVCATRGMMFSDYIEQACREKLKKDGE